MLRKVYRVLFSIACMWCMFGITHTNAVTCQPPFNGNRTVEGDCTYPTTWLKVYGDVIVGSRTVTVPNGATLGIDLSTNKATFTTGKILFSGTGKMDNTVSNRNFVTVSYSSATGNVNCPSGYAILNTWGTWYQWSSITDVASSGTIRCWKL